MNPTPNKRYNIKALEWSLTASPVKQSFIARVPMGSYTIERERRSRAWNAPFGPWELSYCFDELYDAGVIPVTSLEDAETKAFEDWCRRIAPALIEVE